MTPFAAAGFLGFEEGDVDLFLAGVITVIVLVAVLLWALGRRSRANDDEPTARRLAAEAKRNREGGWDLMP